MLSRLARYASSMMTRASSKLGMAKAVFCLGVLVCLVLSYSPIPAKASDCYYSLAGLIDLHGRKIIECKYGSIHDLGAGLFGAKEPAPGGNDLSSPIHVFNRQGNELEISIPENSELINVLFVQAPAQNSDSVDKLPPDALLELRTDRLYRLIKLDGTVLLRDYEFPLYRMKRANYVVFIDSQTFWSLPLIEHPCRMFAIELTSGEKVLSGPVLDRIRDEIGARRTKIPGNEQIVGKDFDGKNIVCNVCQKGRADESDGFCDDGWNGGYAIICSASRKNGRRLDFGIANSKKEITVIPQYSRIQYLFDNVYMAQISKGSSAFLINGEGKRLPISLPNGTYDGLYKGGLILCEQGEELPQKEKRISVLNRAFQPVVDSVRGISGGFAHGVLAKLTPLDGGSDFEGTYDVVTKDGLIGTGIKATNLWPLTGELLVIRERQPARQVEIRGKSK